MIDKETIRLVINPEGPDLELAKKAKDLVGRVVTVTGLEAHDGSVRIDMVPTDLDRIRGTKLIEHIRDGFRVTAATMFPQFKEWNGTQFRDMVRLTLLGAMLSRPSDRLLDELVTEMSHPGWMPDASWRWGPVADMMDQAGMKP